MEPPCNSERMDTPATKGHIDTMTDASGRNKANKAEMALRVEAVRGLLLTGYPTHEILRLVAEKWGVADRTVEYYIAQARRSILEASEERKVEVVAEHIEMRRNLLRKAHEGKDYRLALDILKDEAKLLGLYAPDRVVMDFRQEAEKLAAATGLDVADLIAEAERLVSEAGRG